MQTDDKMIKLWITNNQGNPNLDKICLHAPWHSRFDIDSEMKRKEFVRKKKSSTFLLGIQIGLETMSYTMEVPNKNT